MLQFSPVLPQDWIGADIFSSDEVWLGFALLSAVAAYRALLGGTLNAVSEGCSRQVMLLLGVVSASLAGYSYAAWRAADRVKEQLPTNWDGEMALLQGEVISLPQALPQGWRFIVRPETVCLLQRQTYLAGPFCDEGQGSLHPVASNFPRQLQLSWYAPEGEMLPPAQVKPGQYFQWQVRLKRPHSTFNPGSLDYEGWLFAQGVRAVGVIHAQQAYSVQHPQPGWRSRIEAWRWVLRQQFLTALEAWAEQQPEDMRGVLVALAIGDQRSIPDAQWQIFTRTGISHLVAISGGHVTFFAVGCMWLAGALWRRWSVGCQRIPAPWVAVWVGVLAAWAYSLLAGFALPAQRTAWMVLLMASVLSLRRQVSVFVAWWLALLIIVLYDPWAVLSAGFWLSFVAVAALLTTPVMRHGGSLSMELNGRNRWWERCRQEWRAQWRVTWLTLPWVLGLFQQFSLISPLTNAIAIPVVSLLITPLVLLFIVLPWPPLLMVAHQLMLGLFLTLRWCAELPWAVWQQAAAPGWLWCPAVLGSVAFVWFAASRWRWCGWLPLGVMLFWHSPRPDEGEFQLTVLDVGQGLSIHIQTAQHDLLYDAGPAFSQAANSGQRIVLPYLRHQGVQGLDGLVITHADQDHAGGAAAILAQLPVRWLLASLPPAHHLWGKAQRDVVCQAGQQWVWDSVRFEVLYPAAQDVKQRSNDDSCVLRIEGRYGSALLTADLEARGELALLQRHASLHADWVLAPHHGSQTSSLPDFVRESNPQHLVFTVGYRNRYGHPHPVIWSRWQQLSETDLRITRSDTYGSIRYFFDKESLRFQSYRETGARYWHWQ